MTSTTTISRSHAGARFALAVACAGGLAALAWAAFATPTVRVIYNPTDSVPIGWYRIAPVRSLHVGSIVLAQLPAGAASLAAQRGYLPLRVPLLKRVGAMAPQSVCVFDELVWIDGVPVTKLLRADRLGRTLPSWRACRTLADGELFLLSSTNPASFDSRYFGPIRMSAVIGEAYPIDVEN
jgi:conjugative transfer signal peptidase TraF